MRPDWREGWRLAWSKPFVRRGLKFLVIVGGIQIAINHGHALLQGDVDLGRSIRMVLTATVPYCVATLSAVLTQLATLRRDRDQRPKDLPGSEPQLRRQQP